MLKLSWQTLVCPVSHQTGKTLTQTAILLFCGRVGRYHCFVFRCTAGQLPTGSITTTELTRVTAERYCLWPKYVSLGLVWLDTEEQKSAWEKDSKIVLYLTFGDSVSCWFIVSCFNSSHDVNLQKDDLYTAVLSQMLTWPVSSLTFLTSNSNFH